MPTRGANILDLVLCNDNNFVHDVNVDMPIATSDHNCVEFALSVSRFTPPNNGVCKERDFYRADYCAINNILMHIDWDSVFRCCANVNDLWLEFHKIVDKISSFQMHINSCMSKPSIIKVLLLHR